MVIRPISRENSGDLLLHNDPFSMPGRMIPGLKDGQWSYQIQYFDHPEEMVFPEEGYTLDAVNQNGFALGAYLQDTCVGLAVFRDSWFRYMHLYDLKVSASARGQGVGRALIEAGAAAARERGYGGIFCQAQDNNLNACLFYLQTGFEIGGFDNRVYRGTKQKGKADILFYLDASEGLMK